MDASRGDDGPGSSFEELWSAFRALVNTRELAPAAPELLAVQDELLQGLIAEAGITRVEDVAPCPADTRMGLWRGDITTIAADAIVNAANSAMTGCWQPLHSCIDNAIHTFAGVQLRLECARIMAAQGHPEPTAQAKVTGAYNLSCRRIIHTVGPIAQGGRPPRGIGASSRGAMRRAWTPRRRRASQASRFAASAPACSAFLKPRPRRSRSKPFARGSTRIPMPVFASCSTSSSTRTSPSTGACSASRSVRRAGFGADVR